MTAKVNNASIKAEIMRETDPFRGSTMCMGSRMTVSTSGLLLATS